MSSDPVDQLATAFDATGQILIAVRDEQWSAPTPCSEWTVRDLVGHMVTSNHAFVRILNGEPARAPGGTTPEAPAAAGRMAGWWRPTATPRRRWSAAFRQPGVLDRVHTVPIGPVPGIAALHLRITEVLVHGWDLARATGQHAKFPEDLAEQELAFSRRKLGDIPAGRTPFAPPQPVPDDAPAIDRLAALLGRKVST